ncbi:AraC family transcriptional regulator [Streptomyces varsoviensis]|uniref:AraC family transcriptional regulator n=1 Tax=Streptomyces varsoviensis TaxID=67373 RepID=UPI0033C6447B
MDPIDDLLATMRIEDARYTRVAARAPWGISFPPRHLARLVLISTGSCWLTSDVLDGPRRLGADDCFLVRAGVGFTLRDERGRPVVDCEEAFVRGPGGTARAGGDGAPTEIVSSRFAFDAVAAEPLFTLLPPLFRLHLDDTAGHLLRATFDLIAAEGATGRIGAGFVMSRLSDVLFVQALRACCAEFGGGAVGWLAALRDPRLAPALRALHEDLARPWTVDALARKAGMSRSAFAALFKEKAGDTPLGYLTAWRMYRVKTLLRESPLSVQEIAVRVGYDTGSALSRAFLRREGLSPGAWRQSRGRPAAAGGA